jgi:hypothetical protein
MSDNKKEFEDNKIECQALINLSWPNLIEFGSNNYPNIIVDILNCTSSDISNAINEESIKHFKELPDIISDYINITIDSISYRIIDDKIKKLLKKINLFIYNWIRMNNEIEESPYNLGEDKIKKYEYAITKINDIVDMSCTVSNLINVSNNLIKKAETVLAATPRTFNMSDHFSKALQKEIEEENDI